MAGRGDVDTHHATPASIDALHNETSAERVAPLPLLATGRPSSFAGE